MLEQFSDRDAVLDVGRAIGALGGAVGEHTGEGRLEQVEDAPPVVSLAFHRQAQNAGGLEPIPQPRTSAPLDHPLPESSRQSAGAARLSPARGPPGVVIPR
jgi:hypothetical protein